jgi:phage gp36-like protein
MTLQVINTYCSDQDVQTALSIAGWTAMLDDNEDGTVSATEDLRMDDALVRASERCNEFLYDRYDPLQLANSNAVHMYATDIASYYLCNSVGREAPNSVTDRYETAMEMLERYHSGDLRLPGIPQRGPALAWSNQRVVVLYQFRALRTIRATSQPQSTTQRQYVDREAELTIEPP